MTSTDTRVIAHWLDGKPFAGTSEDTATVTNPATGQITGRLALANLEDARAVIDAAAAAFPAWRDTSLARRTQVLFSFRELLNARKGELAEIITAEHGKVLSDALGEISRGQEVVEFACGIPHLLKGGYTENASTKVDVYSIRQPLGPVGIISPFNFPAMVPMWFFPVAIAAGNTVILKPSEKDPTAAIWLAELWAEAGLPPGVFNVLQGDKLAVDELLENKAVKAISFVGSTPIAQYVYATGTANGTEQESLDKEKMIGLKQRQTFQRAVKAGVPMVFGSDAGVYPHGDNARQFAVMVRYGATPLQAIQSATVTAAEALGQSKDVGQVAVGRYGDMIAVSGDPLSDVTVLEKPVFVMKGGAVVRQP